MIVSNSFEVAYQLTRAGVDVAAILGDGLHIREITAPLFFGFVDNLASSLILF